MPQMGVEDGNGVLAFLVVHPVRIVRSVRNPKSTRSKEPRAVWNYNHTLIRGSVWARLIAVPGERKQWLLISVRRNSGVLRVSSVVKSKLLPVWHA